MDTLQITLDDQVVTLETGRLAPRAAGAVLARCGDAALLATVATSPIEGEPGDHLPLMVDYRERTAAAGRIPGNYLRREVRQGEAEILLSRLVDRALRPLLKGAPHQRIHVSLTVYSHDPAVDRAGLALVAAGAALQVSPLPFHGPLVGGRLLGTDEGLVTWAGASESGPVDLTLALSPAGIVMLEGALDRVDDGAVLAALHVAQGLWGEALDTLAAWRPCPAPVEVAPDDQPRPDGRALDEVRALEAECGLLPSNHGSALFSRGQTQALVSATLGTSRDGQDLETLDGHERRRFLLHYNFPGFAVGEAGGNRGPGRRELGHGELARRALLPVLPAPQHFPYAARVVSDILGSDGSSSMATVCGASLALRHAGVPLHAPVAGVAMGARWTSGGWQVLTDITGDEDAGGAMDFKVAGTAEHLTALQLDNKHGALPLSLLANALSQAGTARRHILDAMAPAFTGAIERPSPNAPRTLHVQVPPHRVGVVIGSGGKRLQQIQSKTGAKIDVQDDGTVLIQAADGAAAEEAKAMVQASALELTKGGLYGGQITRLKDFGAFVRLGTQEALVHKSELVAGAAPDPADVVKVGQHVVVRVLGTDSKGRLKLSIKAAEGADPSQVQQLG